MFCKTKPRTGLLNLVADNDLLVTQSIPFEDWGLEFAKTSEVLVVIAKGSGKDPVLAQLPCLFKLTRT